jgi:hypothetical protein
MSLCSGHEVRSSVVKAIFVAAVFLVCAVPATGNSVRMGSVREAGPVDDMFRLDSTEGARCTIVRDGKLIVDFVETGGADARATQIVWLSTASRHDIVVTCSKSGFWTRSKVVSISSGRWIADSGPCMVPNGLPADQVQDYCKKYYSPPPPSPEFPAYPMVTLILHRSKSR